MNNSEFAEELQSLVPKTLVVFGHVEGENHFLSVLRGSDSAKIWEGKIVKKEGSPAVFNCESVWLYPNPNSPMIEGTILEKPETLDAACAWLTQRLLNRERLGQL